MSVRALAAVRAVGRDSASKQSRVVGKIKLNNKGKKVHKASGLMPVSLFGFHAAALFQAVNRRRRNEELDSLRAEKRLGNEGSFHPPQLFFFLKEYSEWLWKRAAHGNGNS